MTEIKRFTLNNLRSVFQINGFEVKIKYVVVYYRYNENEVEKVPETVKDIFEALEEENPDKFIEAYKILETLKHVCDISNNVELGILIDNDYDTYEKLDDIILLLSNCRFIEKTYSFLSKDELGSILEKALNKKIFIYYVWEKRPHYLSDKILEEIKYLLDNNKVLSEDFLIRILYFFLHNYDYTKASPQDDIVIKLYEKLQRAGVEVETFFNLFTQAIISSYKHVCLDDYIEALKMILYYDKKLNLSKQINLENLSYSTKHFLLFYLFLPIIYDNAYLLEQSYDEISSEYVQTIYDKVPIECIYAIYEKGCINPDFFIIEEVYKEVANIFCTSLLLTFSEPNTNELKKIARKNGIPFI